VAKRNKTERVRSNSGETTKQKPVSAALHSALKKKFDAQALDFQEQQTATSEILNVIASSPANLEAVLNVVDET
jgi:hypothetical protein